MRKNRLPPFVPLLVDTLNSPAWCALSHGAKVLYVSIKRRVPKFRNKAYLSYRLAAAELKSSQRKIGEWFHELEHYGFIVLAHPGSLGVDGKGKSPQWRLTELGNTSQTSSTGLPDPPTRDFLKWDGTPFDPTPFRQPKKQNPASYGGSVPLPTGEAPPLPTREAPPSDSASYGVGIEREQSASYGVGITSITTEGSTTGAPSDGEYDDLTVPDFLDRRRQARIGGDGVDGLT